MVEQPVAAYNYILLHVHTNMITCASMEIHQVCICIITYIGGLQVLHENYTGTPTSRVHGHCETPTPASTDYSASEPYPPLLAIVAEIQLIGIGIGGAPGTRAPHCAPLLLDAGIWLSR